jgi:hypothetical protein
VTPLVSEEGFSDGLTIEELSETITFLNMIGAIGVFHVTCSDDQFAHKRRIEFERDRRPPGTFLTEARGSGSSAVLVRHERSGLDDPQRLPRFSAFSFCCRNSHRKSHWFCRSVHKRAVRPHVRSLRRSLARLRILLRAAAAASGPARSGTRDRFPRECRPVREARPEVTLHRQSHGMVQSVKLSNGSALGLRQQTNQRRDQSRRFEDGK